MEHRNDGIRTLLDSIKGVIENSEFSRGQSNEDHIKKILNRLYENEFPEYPTFDFEVTKKCPKISNKFRKKGEEYLTSEQNSSLDMALEEYTKSIAYAPLKSEELARGYDGRSAVFFRARLISDCLLDISRALIIGQSLNNESKAELYLRKAICLRTLDQHNLTEIEEALTESRNWIERMPDEEEKNILKKKFVEQENVRYIDKSRFFRWNAEKYLPKLESENPMIPGLSDAVELRYSDKFGRYMCATRDIKPGELLVMQKPYAKIVNTEMRYKFCWFCAEQTWASLPCDNCSEVVYCSEICREKGRLEHHELECPVISSMIDLEMIEGMFVSLKLTVLAYKEAGESLEMLKKNLEKIDTEKDPLMRGFTNEILEPKKYSSVYGLVTHSEDLIPSECPFVVDSIIIAYLLATRTNLFGKKLKKFLPDSKEDQRFIFLVGLIEKNMQVSNYNSFSVEGNTRTQKFRAIVPSSSFFNHCCNQTIIRRFHGEYMTSTVLFPIKKEDQIFDNYGVYYDQLPRDERQSELFLLYRFVCDCEACKYDWPMSASESDVIYKNFKGFTKMALRFREIYSEYSIIKRIMNSFGKKYNCVPDVSKHVLDLVEIIEKFSRRFKKNSAEIVDAVLLLDGLLSLTENRYFLLE